MPKAVTRVALGLAMAALMALPSACTSSTPYQPLSALSPASGGYADKQLGQDRHQVTFVGNMLTSRERVESYLLFRAAELTLEQGADWFVVVDHEMDHEIERVIRRDPTYRPSFGAQYGDWRPYWRYRDPSSGWRDWDPYHGDPFWTGDADVLTIERFEATAEIRLGRGAVPAGEDKAMVAREVIAEIGPQVEYPED